jgi:hypothetical protein
MTDFIFTQAGRYTLGKVLVQAINQEFPDPDTFYFFVSNHDIADPDDLYDNVRITNISAYRNMIFGKRIQPNDAMTVTRNVPWVSGKVFSMYDDTNANLLFEDFYCMVNAGSFYHVYKCLDNNANTGSTSQPDFTAIEGANTILYQTADGYRWKYMYTVDETQVNNFSTAAYFPVTTNDEVVALSTNGAIDIIAVVNSGGRGYDNYITGTFGLGDVQVGGNNNLFSISAAGNTVSPDDGFYTGCIIYIYSGSGIGQYRDIVDYVVNSSGNFIVTNTVFLEPQNSSGYQIYPKVLISGDGQQTTNAVARALVNSLASNSIYRVEMLNRGAEYFWVTANVVANDVVGVQEEATLRPIYSPPGGHGRDPNFELPFVGVALNIRLANNEANTILDTGQYKSFGIIKNPAFSNVQIEQADTAGVFLVGEPIVQLYPISVGYASLNATGYLNFSSSDIRTTWPGFPILLQDADSGDTYFTTVTDQVNSTVLVVNTTFLSAVSDTANLEVLMSFNFTETGLVIINSDGSNIWVANVVHPLEVGDTIMGLVSGATATINALSRNNVEKNFDTFVELWTFETSGVVGSFSENELVLNNAETRQGSLYAAVLNTDAKTYLYTTNQVGIFFGSGIDHVSGANSGATAIIQEVFPPEVAYGSGEVIYMRNIGATITRTEEQTEAFKIILT